MFINYYFNYEKDTVIQGTTIKDELFKNRGLSLDNIQYLSINNTMINLPIKDEDILNKQISENDVLICITTNMNSEYLYQNYLTHILAGFFHQDLEVSTNFINYLKKQQIIFIDIDDISFYISINLIKLGFTNIDFYLPNKYSLKDNIIHNGFLSYQLNSEQIIDKLQTFLQQQSVLPLNINFKNKDLSLDNLTKQNDYIVINTTFNKKFYAYLKRQIQQLASNLFIDFYILKYITSYLYIGQIYNYIEQINNTVKINNIISLDRQDDVDRIDEIIHDFSFKKPDLPITYMLCNIYAQYIAEQILYNKVGTFNKLQRGEPYVRTDV
ncbi:hypothetical protein DEFDS_P246 (plasmid) [Deferribacter desulfuricans SSM1]|uniref:Uncharacterized protein n=1 Tax=Deferribacter desulfuricans (strain DSM 14783 / JCM 11476 / NBRC 101012 / SSM1) TaxID=639282 RepID=D3PF74_DEFDS|nr:hypothetical protein [Deferribacter desulfuricans]BAI81866.1 hypothetical protein DEFDS_P246 [Deferribacter desulfuricans SSM1]